MNLVFRLRLLSGSEASEASVWRAIQENNRHALEKLLACMTECEIESFRGISRNEVRARIDLAVVSELDWMAVECHRHRDHPEIVDAVLDVARELLVRFPHFEHAFILGVPQYRERYCADDDTMEIECGDDD